MGAERDSSLRSVEGHVIPAKAGIQLADRAFHKTCGVDSRFGGNDCALERPYPSYDTSTPCRVQLTPLLWRLMLE